MLELIKDYLSDKNKLWKMIMIFSIVLFFLVLFVFIWRLLPHQTSTDISDSQDKDTQKEQQVSLPPKKCDGCTRRLLDGVYVKPEEANLQPIAIMIDNHPSARPQVGIDKANLVYEAEVEGNYTRFMAIFASSEKINQIGPVRSARSYFVDWAEDIGAIYAHCGGSPEALAELTQKDLPDLNEMYNGQYFWRAANRTAPHNILTSSTNLDKYKENKKIISGDYSLWLFKDDNPSDNSSTTKKIDIDFRHIDFKTSWVYDKTDNDYIRYYGDKPYLTSDNNLIVAKNIIIQYLPAKVVDDKLRLDMDTVGEGKALICLDGICQKGQWHKKGEKIRTKFNYDNKDEVQLNAGTTWIEVVRPEISVNY